jgi:phospholipid/cholesterol/gamma-HCH transport system substrate-binding protein
METQARYTLVGSFVLAAVLAVFAFVYWLHNTGGLADRQLFRVRFQASVSGLLKGSSVLFNGIRVGEVTEIQLSPDAPKDVLVTIAVEHFVPVRADTVVNVDFQGLTGAPVIELRGGESKAAPLTPGPDGPPLIEASAESTQSLTQSARGTLNRLDKVIDDNSSALHDAITGISNFAGVLSRNSERIDGILAGLERFTGGGAKAKPGIYSLTALAGSAGCADAARPQLVVPEPAAPLAFNSDKVVVVGDPPENAPFEKAQFTDNIPAVVQSKVIESFEGSGCFAAVTRPIDSLEPSDQLQTEIRQFAIVMAPKPAATVELSIKLVSAGGKITGSRDFKETAALSTVDAPGAVAALDGAFGKVLAAAVPWVAKLPVDAEPPAPEPAAPEPPAP